MKKSTRLKISLPQIVSRDDAEAIVGEIALATINQIRTTARMDAEIAAVRKRYEGNLSVIAADLKAKTETLHAWAEANPQEFGKKKSVEFTQGTIGFRTGTPRLALLNRKWNWESVLAGLQQLLPAFVRFKPEVDKEALLAQRDEEIIRTMLPRFGMKVVQDEGFFVEPKLTEVETRQTASQEAA